MYSSDGLNMGYIKKNISSVGKRNTIDHMGGATFFDLSEP